MSAATLKTDAIQASSAANVLMLSPEVLATGSSSAGTAPLQFVSGPVLATPEAGTEEYDGRCFYKTPVASSRGVEIVDHFICQVSNRANIANDANAHAIFDAVANGTLTLSAATGYEFEMEFAMSTTGTGARTLGILFVFSNAPTAISYTALANSLGATGFATLATAQMIFSSVATVVQVNASASAASYNVVKVKGIVRTNLATTLIPQMQWSGAPGQVSVVQAGSRFKMHAIGSNTVASVGNWS